MADQRVNEHLALCAKIHELYEMKNADYGDSFRKVRDEIPNAILVRLSDKLNRLKSLMNKGEDPLVKNESIDDTLMDLANYALLELVERRMDEISKSTKAPADFNGYVDPDLGTVLYPVLNPDTRKYEMNKMIYAPNDPNQYKLEIKPGIGSTPL